MLNVSNSKAHCYCAAADNMSATGTIFSNLVRGTVQT